MNMEDRIFAKSEKLRQLRNVVQVCTISIVYISFFFLRCCLLYLLSMRFLMQKVSDFFKAFGCSRWKSDNSKETDERWSTSAKHSSNASFCGSQKSSTTCCNKATTYQNKNNNKCYTCNKEKESSFKITSCLNWKGKFTTLQHSWQTIFVWKHHRLYNNCFVLFWNKFAIWFWKNIWFLLQNKDIAPVRAKHRRSRSSDYWLEHKPTETLQTGLFPLINILIYHSSLAKHLTCKKRRILCLYIDIFSSYAIKSLVCIILLFNFQIR